MGPIAQSTLKTSAVFALRLGVQAGTLLLVARMLGPDTFGAFAGIAALAVLVGTFSTFGTHLVLLGEVSKNKESRDQVLAYAIPTTLISGAILFLLYLCICLLFFDGISVPISAIICIGLTEILLLPLYVFPSMQRLAHEKTASSQLLMTFPLALRMLAAALVMLTAFEQPLIAFVWLYLVSALAALACMKLFVPNAWLSVKQWRLAKRHELKNSAGYAALALTAAGPSELDKMLAVKLLPLGISGVYAAASRVVGAATLPVIALLLSAMPRLFRDKENDLAKNNHLIHWILISVFAYGLVLACALWLSAPIFEWLFGAQYQGIADMLIWLCIAVPGLALRFAVGGILLTMEKPWARASFEVFGMLMLIACAVWFVPLFGYKAMPLVLACSEWGMFFLGTGLIAHIKNVQETNPLSKVEK